VPRQPVTARAYDRPTGKLLWELNGLKRTGQGIAGAGSDLLSSAPAAALGGFGGGPAAAPAAGRVSRCGPGGGRFRRRVGVRGRCLPSRPARPATSA